MLHKLSATTVKNAKPSKYNDGQGLWLVKRTDCDGQWVLRVIPPFLAGHIGRIHAAIFSFCAGVMPPMPILGRSLL